MQRKLLVIATLSAGVVSAFVIACGTASSNDRTPSPQLAATRTPQPVPSATTADGSAKYDTSDNSFEGHEKPPSQPHSSSPGTTQPPAESSALVPFVELVKVRCLPFKHPTAVSSARFVLTQGHVNLACQYRANTTTAVETKAWRSDFDPKATIRVQTYVASSGSPDLEIMDSDLTLAASADPTVFDFDPSRLVTQIRVTFATAIRDLNATSYLQVASSAQRGGKIAATRASFKKGGAVELIYLAWKDDTRIDFVSTVIDAANGEQTLLKSVSVVAPFTGDVSLDKE